MQGQINKIKIYIGVLALGIIWGSTWLAIKFGLEDAPPFFSASLRFVLAFLLLFILLKFKKYKFPTSLQYWKNTTFITIFMFIIPYALVYWGEIYVSSGLSAVLFSTQSLFVIILAHFIKKDEKANLQKIFGLLLGLFGLILIFSEHLDWNEKMGFVGMIGLLFAAASAAFALVLLSRQKHKVEPVPEVTAQLGITAMIFIIISLVFEKVPEDVFTIKLWASVIYLAFLGTAFGFVVYFWIAKHATAVLTSLTVFISPIFAVFLGWLILNETINTIGLIGVALVIIGIIVNQYKFKK